MWTGPTCICMQNSRNLYRLACMRVVSTSYWVRILTSNNEQNIAQRCPIITVGIVRVRYALRVDTLTELLMESQKVK